jgi:LPXTG-motif cell wall-anchored protein
VNGGGASTTVVVGAEAAQQLPFTGSSSFPLAAVGIVFILCGGGLALRKRRLAR